MNEKTKRHWELITRDFTDEELDSAIASLHSRVHELDDLCYFEMLIVERTTREVNERCNGVAR